MSNQLYPFLKYLHFETVLTGCLVSAFALFGKLTLHLDIPQVSFGLKSLAVFDKFSVDELKIVRHFAD